MQRFVLAYRLPDGTLRGFVGFGPTLRHACYECIREVEAVLALFHRDFDANEVLCDVAALVPDEADSGRRG